MAYSRNIIFTIGFIICSLLLPMHAIAVIHEPLPKLSNDHSELITALRRSVRAARAERSDAAAHIALAYAFGEGVEQNTGQALRYLNLGLKKRDPMAINLMAHWLGYGFLAQQHIFDAQYLLDNAELFLFKFTNRKPENTQSIHIYSNFPLDE
ncbi:hypothetical protein ACO1PK_04450 [Alishewanella sp. d11]|uniref:hypothetical protein n=1 Tax=Alishewanella sp. d11 TaxID=3414030 RepID=UPI003BF840B5